MDQCLLLFPHRPAVHLKIRLGKGRDQKVWFPIEFLYQIMFKKIKDANIQELVKKVLNYLTVGDV